MSEILIIPDVHQRWWVIDKAVKEQEEHGYELLFLGDFFDNYNDTLEEVEITAHKVLELSKMPKVKLLLGNHDLPYRFWKHSPLLRCSGNRPEKEKVISSILKPEDWERFHLFHQEFVGDEWWVFSHAGLHTHFAHPIHGWTPEHLERICKEALDECMYAKVPNWLNAGLCRGGYERVGGITWLDWNVEFAPIEGINEVVGHTTLRNPEVLTGVNSANYNLDTNSRHWAIWNNGVMKMTPIESGL